MTITPQTQARPAPLGTDTITQWVESYIRAWRSNDRADIAALFTDEAEYHEAPFETEWIGRDEIVEGWQGRWDWQASGWAFDWSITSVDDMTAIITGIGRYTKLGDFDNVWTVTFDESGRSTRFEMLNTERS